MNWYYLREEGPSGPYEESAMADLSRVGVIKESSLVWVAGLEFWTPVSELGGLQEYLMRPRPDPADDLPETPPRIEIEKCAVSGQLGDRNTMLEYGDQYVLPQYKEQFTLGLYENVKDPSRNQLELEADLSVFTCLKQTFQIIRREWIPFFSLILVLSIPFELTTTYLSFIIWDAEGLATFSILELLDLFVGTLICAGLYSTAASHWQFQGQPNGNIFKTAFGSWMRLLKVRTEVYLAIFVGLLVFVIPGIILAFMLMFAEPLVFSSERESGLNALSGSWNLVKNRLGKALQFAFIYLAIVGSPLFILWAGYLWSPLDNWLIDAGWHVLNDVCLGFGAIFIYCAMEHFDR